ncbi:MAG TPA: hypothetical protein VFX96_13300 [Pyrinomonadaceae bacterium]|nr:hypothetical protein [Pyrinomonadaceae bacterium]
MRATLTNAPPRATLALLALFVSLALLSTTTAAARAQSGRRGAPRTQTGETAETNVPKDSTADSRAADAGAAKKPSINFKLVVAGRIEAKYEDRANIIFNKFLQRLGESSSSVNSLGLMKREDALARARAEDADAYFVWLQLEDDNVQEGSLVLNSSDLVVKYQVYAPGAREAKGKGKVYYQAMGGARARQDRFPSGTPIKITPEAAGEEAAEMVLDWFRLVEGPALSTRKN